MDVIDEYIAPRYIGHDPSEPEPIRGPQGVRAQIEKYLAGFPDARLTVEEQFVAGDRVASRWTGRGTQTGEIAGIAPTGKEVTITGLTFSRASRGARSSRRLSWDTLDVGSSGQSCCLARA